MTSYSIERLIPQRKPMMMVDRMVEANGDIGVTTFTVRPDNIFLSRDGTLDEVALIENMAQSASAMAGLRAISNGATEPPVGYIGEIKKFVCMRRPRVGEELETNIVMGTEVAGVTLIQATVKLQSETIASTSMKIFIPEAAAIHPNTVTISALSKHYPNSADALSDSYFAINSIERGDNQALFHITLKRDCSVYEGHFPDNPVCPGVCNILMLKQCAQKMVGESLHFSQIKQCRLTAVATPLHTSALDADIDITHSDSSYGLTATLSSPQETIMKLKGELIR